MTQKPEQTELDLEAFFAAERANGAEPSDALLTAVLRDGLDLQPDLAGIPIAQTTLASRRWSWRRDFWDALGGWVSVGALTACLVLGVSVGYTPPTGLANFAETVLESSGISVTIDDDFTLDELMAEG